MQEDLALIRELLAGSQAAMEVLVNRHYKTIFAYLYRNTGQYHTSYDLTQEVFIKMMKAIPRFDPSAGSFQSWLFKIAVNTMKDYFKSRGYRSYQETAEADSDLEQADENGNVVELVTRMSESERVKKALLLLDEEKRETIVLRFYHDMKIKDIAQLTETNESTVKSRLRKGIEKLRLFLKEESEDEKNSCKI